MEHAGTPLCQVHTGIASKETKPVYRSSSLQTGTVLESRASARELRAYAECATLQLRHCHRIAAEILDTERPAVLFEESNISYNMEEMLLRVNIATERKSCLAQTEYMY